jgi:hypothetical protein
MEKRTLLVGRISRVEGVPAPGGAAACKFRLGNVRCRANAALAEQIVARQGFPGHSVKVEGELSGAGSAQTLDVVNVDLID